jgi:GGDEF domain-containing protein
VLLADLTDPQDVERIAAIIVESLAVCISFEGREVPVSGSVGVCTASAPELDSDALLRNADAALYRAKARGRGCFVICAPDSWHDKQSSEPDEVIEDPKPF